MIGKRKQQGQGAVEYALLLVLVAIVVIAVLMFLGRNLYSIFYGITEALQFGCGAVSTQTFRSYAGEGGAVSGPISPGYQPTTGHVSQSYWFCHKGLDIAGPEGTPIQAVADGTVKYAGWNTQGYGNMVVIDHGSYQTLYAHMLTTPTVSKGQSVGGGYMIGELGNTGFSTGPHLHFEIRLGSDLVDPQIYLP